jgi:hypothetical protein
MQRLPCHIPAYQFHIDIDSLKCACFCLQEILAATCSPHGHDPLFVWDCAEYREAGGQVLFELHDAGHVTATITVVWRRPYCYYVFVSKVVLLQVS